ncbi:hypothetical protein GLE_2814 [Lysobacter enzymogenes]|uniref:Uncharacterized protein n=2 Tax=Lysobacter TaxID=68 RepID=A0A0S2DIA5_LYSEN|nr:hypothetical protein GLE_2814 [Lysobacter enzymogenes]
MKMKSHVWSTLAPLLLGLLAVFAPRPAQAQAFTCYMYYGKLVGICNTEGSQIFNKAQMIKNVGSELNKINRMKQQLEQEKARFEQLNPGSLNIGSVAGNREFGDLKPRDINEGRDETCHKGKSSVAEEQYKVCVNAVQLRNKRFNVMVQMFKDIEKRDQNIQKIRSDRAGISGPKDNGRLAGNDNASKTIDAAMMNDMQSYVATMELYTTMLKTLDDQMALLANKALANKGSVLGGVVQGAALKAGLAAAESRDL